MSYRRPSGTKANFPVTEGSAGELRVNRKDNGKLLDIANATGQVVFELAGMCAECPALAGLDRDKLLPVTGTCLGATYRQVLRAEELVSPPWTRVYAEDPKNIEVSADRVVLEYHGVPGEILATSADGYIAAANSAVRRCNNANGADPEQGKCGAGEYGLEVQRQFFHVIGYEKDGTVDSEKCRQVTYALPELAARDSDGSEFTYAHTYAPCEG